MTTLVIGAGGQVGRALLARRPDGMQWLATSRDGAAAGGVEMAPLDVTDEAAVTALVARVRPTVVINAAAYTAVDRAEAEPDGAFATNAAAPAAIARACNAVGAFLVHYSTDYVFDGGGAAPYPEDAAVAPLGVYGASKLEGERAVLALAPASLVIRTAWVYAPYGHNFMRTMLRLASERPELRVVDDQVGAPTTADFIARSTIALVNRDERPTGVVNVVCGGATSWYGFADAIVRGAFARGLLKQRPDVTPIPTSAFPTLAKRPAYSVLSIRKLIELGVDVPDWRSELDRTLDLMATQGGSNP
ncbi:dTDP-4-dehydrorhamnose reductase [Cognatilysobacter terrigena]|uniref:dTDP-4-dehydrorhamnose reductase n=1 Tax=Cognatilysobacter terrigena TaxID=2488749 RepID=UPI00105F10D9|nr:dTDP-4-dehydrorhamnose reductase [Lysobacter terrigena]